MVPGSIRCICFDHCLSFAGQLDHLRRSSSRRSLPVAFGPDDGGRRLGNRRNGPCAATRRQRKLVGMETAVVWKRTLCIGDASRCFPPVLSCHRGLDVVHTGGRIVRADLQRLGQELARPGPLRRPRAARSRRPGKRPDRPETSNMPPRQPASPAQCRRGLAVRARLPHKRQGVRETSCGPASSARPAASDRLASSGSRPRQTPDRHPPENCHALIGQHVRGSDLAHHGSGTAHRLSSLRVGRAGLS